jgi:hypothetical protein
VAEGIAARDGRVEVRRHVENKGHLATYNEGLLGWADRDYAVLLSADDLLTPGALQRATRIMDERPSVGLVYGRSAYFVDNDDLPSIGRRALGVKVWPGQEWLARRCRSGVSVISSPEVVVRTSVQHQVGGYRPNLPHAGDLEMWLRFAAVGDVAYVRGLAQAFYRRHPQSMLRTRFNTVLADLEQRRTAFDTFFADQPDLRDRDALERAAHLALANDALEQACRAVEHDRGDVIPVDALVDLARECVPDLESLRRYRALRRRQRLGASVCDRTHVFAPTQVVRRARSWLWWRSWALRGV